MSSMPPSNVPPQAQPVEPVPVPVARPDLRIIAQQQRILLLCILVYLIAIVARLTLPPQLQIFVGLAGAAAIITATVFVFMLAIRLHGTGVGILLGILTLIPLIGLISLLIVNQKATNELKSHGIQVGLLGAKRMP